jgi:cyclic pyranopterin phosphate synthase
LTGKWKSAKSVCSKKPAEKAAFGKTMTDSRGRNIEYLRLSLTDKCNLRCSYCRDASESPTGFGLSPAQIERVVGCMARLGIVKVRLTGGEPLMRRDLEEIVEAVSAHKAIRDICMTTNAHGLAARAGALKKAGLMRINISLDSLDKKRFTEITGGGDLNQVLEGIDAALDAGLSPVILNCVVIRGRNDDEIVGFIALAKEKPLHVRFIELMPMGGAKNDELRIGNDEILKRRPELAPVVAQNAGQPAVEYTAKNFLGTVGFISPMTRPFCNNCSRVRITHDGKLRPCLGGDAETDLLPLLGEIRGGESDDDALLEKIKQTIFNKPKGHRFNEDFVSARRMNRIGG